METESIYDEQYINELENTAKSLMSSSDSIKDDILNRDKEFPPVKNDGNIPHDEINLGNELGTFKKTTDADINEVFEKLPSFVFQLKSCLFRACDIDVDNRTFVCELLNGPS